MHKQTRFTGKNVTLIGLGARTHIALSRFLVSQGANVTISDAKTALQLGVELHLLGDLPVRLGLGGHRDEDVLGADIVFVTPGAPRDMPCLVKAQQKGIPLSSEIELLFELCPAEIVGITGSSGKTTTTTLVGLMAKADGRSTLVGGNIGLPLIDRIAQIAPTDLLVLELSSFQLEYLRRSPHVGAILNITPNHLDRHGTMERYAAAKFNILAHQSPDDYAVLGIDNADAARLADRSIGRVLAFSMTKPVAQGASLEGDRLMLRFGDRVETICHPADLRMRGRHNIGNGLAAMAIATAAGVRSGAIREVITTFRGVEHRLELVREFQGVGYFNDSIATSPERTVAALRSFTEPIVLLAGGRSKHLPLAEMATLIVDRCRGVVLFGEMAKELEEAISGIPGSDRLESRTVASLEEAVNAARKVARPGDAVVLSPGGTSFDRFRDFEERGHAFQSAVWELRE